MSNEARGAAHGPEGQIQPGDAACIPRRPWRSPQGCPGTLRRGMPIGEVVQQAALMMAMASAIREYTAKEIGPL